MAVNGSLFGGVLDPALRAIALAQTGGNSPFGSPFGGAIDPALNQVHQSILQNATSLMSQPNRSAPIMAGGQPPAQMLPAPSDRAPIPQVDNTLAIGQSMFDPTLRYRQQQQPSQPAKPTSDSPRVVKPEDQQSQWQQKQIDAFNEYMKLASDASSGKAPSKQPPKFGTLDLILGLLPAVLGGRHGGDYLANYLAGKLAGNDAQYQDQMQHYQMGQAQSQDKAKLALQQSSMYGDLASRDQAQKNYEETRKTNEADRYLNLSGQVGNQIAQMVNAGKPEGIPALFGVMNDYRVKAGLPIMDQGAIDSAVSDATDLRTKTEDYKAVQQHQTTINSPNAPIAQKRAAIRQLSELVAKYPDLGSRYGYSQSELASLQTELDKPTKAELDAKHVELTNEILKEQLKAMPEKLKAELNNLVTTGKINDARLQGMNIALKYADQKQKNDIAKGEATLAKMQDDKVLGRDDIAGLKAYGDVIKSAMSAIRGKYPANKLTGISEPMSEADKKEYESLESSLKELIPVMTPKPLAQSKSARIASTEATKDVQIGSKILGQTVLNANEVALFRQAQAALQRDPNATGEVGRRLLAKLQELRGKK